MIGVDKIEDIRKRARGGEPIASIARAVGASEPTVRKYARMKDLSPEPPRRREPESEVLAPYEGTIDCLCQAGDEQSDTRNLSSLADGLVKRSPFRASAPRPCGGLAPRTR